MLSFLEFSSTSFTNKESNPYLLKSFLGYHLEDNRLFFGKCKQLNNTRVYTRVEEFDRSVTCPWKHAVVCTDGVSDEGISSFPAKDTSSSWKFHLPLECLSALFGSKRNLKDFGTLHFEDKRLADDSEMQKSDFFGPNFMKPLFKDTQKSSLLRTVGVIRSIQTCSVSEDQFVQISSGLSVVRSSLAVIASPPFFHEDSNFLEFLISKTNDPCGLSKMKVGQQLHMSPVMGSGLECIYPSETERLLIFVDCPQGIAAARSFLKWHLFRALSGTGTYRTTQVTLFYEAPKSSSMAFVSDFRDWNVFGVEVIPVTQCDLKEFIPTYLNSKPFRASNTASIFCVSSDRTASFLQSLMLYHGVKMSFMQSITQERLEREVTKFRRKQRMEDAYSETADSDAEDMEREVLEEKIWNTWKKQREAMWSEFMKRKESVNASAYSDSNTDKASWDDWFSRNSETWEENIWDDHMWETYWHTWKEDREAWFRAGSYNPRDFGGPGSYTKSGYGYYDTSSRQFEDHHTSSNNSYSSQEYSSSFNGTSFDPFGVLGLQQFASFKEVKQAYRQQALKWHPDLKRNDLETSKKQMQQIILAYQILKEKHRNGNL
eukprot:jgi/Galph1/5653/GphlegSOOS_G4214.1